MIPFTELDSSRSKRGRYPEGRTTLIAKMQRGEFPRGIKLRPLGPSLFDESALDVYDRVLAGTSDAPKAVEAADRFLVQRAREALAACGMEATTS